MIVFLMELWSQILELPLESIRKAKAYQGACYAPRNLCDRRACAAGVSVGIMPSHLLPSTAQSSMKENLKHLDDLSKVIHAEQ